jgi:hypothetical protein
MLELLKRIPELSRHSFRYLFGPLVGSAQSIGLELAMDLLEASTLFDYLTQTQLA